MIVKHAADSHARIKRLTKFVVPGLMGLTLVLGVAFGAVSAAPPPSPQQLQNVLQQDGAGYPSVVARVNGRPLSGKELAQRVAVVQQSQALGAAKADPVQTALDQMIEEAVLIDAAGQRGIAISEDEARASAQMHVQRTTAMPGGKELIATYAADLGVTPDRYAADSRVVAAYQQGMILGEMRAQLADTLPAARRGDPAAVQAAVKSFVAQSGANVEVLIAR